MSSRFAPILALLTMLLAACGSCAPIRWYDRSVNEQYNAGVQITVTCGEDTHFGSGVLVGADRILTARHVAECALIQGLPIYAAPVKVTVNAGDGVEHEAEVEILLGDGAKDIARLKLISSTLAKYQTPIAIGPMPALGERVCEASMVPRPTYRCGMVQETDGYIRVEMRTENGNSGSGLYSQNGLLVGIVVQLWRCQGGEFCGGRAAPLQDARYLIP